MKLIGEFSQALAEDGKAVNTVRSYSGAVAAYGRWYQETYGAEVHQFYRANILDYISYLRTVRSLSNRSVNAKLSALISYNEFLIAHGIQKNLVLGKKDFLKVQQAYANPSTLSKVQLEEFRQKILVECGKRDHAIVTILAYAGLCISETLAIMLGDINLAAREVRVCGKGSKERVVILNDKIVNAVQEYLKERSSDCPISLSAARAAGWIGARSTGFLINTPILLRPIPCATFSAPKPSRGGIPWLGSPIRPVTAIFTQP